MTNCFFLIQIAKGFFSGFNIVACMTHCFLADCQQSMAGNSSVLHGFSAGATKHCSFIKKERAPAFVSYS